MFNISKEQKCFYVKCILYNSVVVVDPDLKSFRIQELCGSYSRSILSSFVDPDPDTNFEYGSRATLLKIRKIDSTLHTL